MKIVMTLKDRLSLFAAAVVAVIGFGLLFQNCARGFSAVSMTADLPMGHPSIAESLEDPPRDIVMAQSKLLIGDQRFLESAFREAFLFPDSPQNERDFLEAVFIQEFRQEQHLLGRGCDPLESGDGNICNGILNNASISMSPSTSSGREAARLQVCRRVIASTLMDRVVKKVSGGDITPNSESMEAIVRLFYPNMDQEVVDQAVQNLAELDLAMAKGAERISDRWRLLMLTVCESTGWEAL